MERLISFLARVYRSAVDWFTCADLMEEQKIFAKLVEELEECEMAPEINRKRYFAIENKKAQEKYTYR